MKNKIKIPTAREVAENFIHTTPFILKTLTELKELVGEMKLEDSKKMVSVVQDLAAHCYSLGASIVADCAGFEVSDLFADEDEDNADSIKN